MDYTREVNAFIDWLETNPLEATAQTLWFHLMVIANKSGYPEWFSVVNLTLMAKTGVSEKSLIKHRNSLIQKGRIEYKNQGKKIAGKYKIIPLTGIFPVIRGVNGEVIRGVNEGVNPSALLSSLNSSASAATSMPPPVYESYYAAHIRLWKNPCTPYQAEALGHYIDKDGMEEKVVIRAMERAALKGRGYSFGLIIKILNDYLNSGARTLGQAEALDEHFEAVKDEGDQVGGPPPHSDRSYRSGGQQKQFDLLDQFTEEEKAREQIRSV